MKSEAYDQFSNSYIRLAHEINKHIEGYIDAYYGPQSIKAEAEAAPLKPPQQLLKDHNRLRELIPTGDSKRHRYLDAVVNAMACTISKLNGQEYEYLDEVNKLYGISPQLVAEREFLAIHNSLDTIIPGKGALEERVDRWNKRFNIPAQDIPKAVDLIVEEIRPRSGNIIDLFAGESVTFEFLKDKPWGADCKYLGNFQSSVRINIEIDWHVLGLTYLMTHEAYPGHHVELQTKEKYLWKDKGYAEESIILLHSPWSVIAEGIANTAIEIISPEMEIYDWMADVLIPELKLPKIEASVLYQMRNANVTLGYVASNVAILFHTGKIGQKEALEYLETYGLLNRKRAQQTFRFMTNPLISTYIFNYTEGYRLIANAANGKSKLPLFKKLLSQHVLPEDLSSTI